MDPPLALGNKLGDHSNFIGLFQTLTYIKLKKSIDYFESIVALNQNTRTHFGPEITFLAIMTFTFWLFRILAIGKYHTTLVTCYNDDTEDM